ncbi:MAG TPA: hypothetical protein VK616_13280, partial [Flavitalea sp.]|nr:hypothetical protein [Flavitalea sp.]
MKKIRTALVSCTAFFCLLNSLVGQTDLIGTTFKLPGHPRILLLKDEENKIKETISDDKIWQNMQNAILSECNKLIDQPPLERIQIGRRLLGTSREALRRIFMLSYAWRMTKDPAILKRVEKELLAVSSFSDWNPSHFLDVAAMTMAVSIGYDWLYASLS